MRTCPACQNQYSDDTAFRPRDGTPLPRHRPGTESELNIGLSKRYLVVKKLGEGGMGSVFLAEQLALGRKVAIKVLRRSLLDDPNFLSRFQDEALTLGRISHQNVVMVHECAQTDDSLPYIAMQYLEGETLASAIDRRGPLPLSEVAEILQQAARGLNAAHKLDIVHRDLKPDNIFLTHDDDGRLLVKIVDFGIAKMRESPNHTNTGAFIGTAAYMSSEQASGMKSAELDKRSDVYSLGVVAYEMLTGRLPFEADTLWGYVNKHVNERAPRMQGVPEQAERVVMIALEKNRDQRYATAPDFAREFAAAVAEAPKTVVTAQPPAAPVPPVPSRSETLLETPQPVRVPIPAPYQPVAVTSPKKASSLRNAVLGLVLGAVLAVGLFIFREKLLVPKVPDTLLAGTERINPKDGLKYVWIPPGTFQMGCSPGDGECYSNERPAHQVTISKGFWLGQTEVTQAAWKKVMNSNPSYFKGDQLPVEQISWDDSTKYCEAVGLRLPTEAEWEYAARAGSTAARYGELDAIAWYRGNSGRQTHAVGSKQANAFGLFDMLGNVDEWIADWYTDSYGVTSAEKDRVLRGGSWGNLPQDVRVSIRDGLGPGGRGNFIGCRCAGKLP